MTSEQKKEQFSLAYIQAVAAAADVSISRPAVDDDSIDLTLLKQAGGGRVRSPKIDVQVKCTETVVLGEEGFAFPLKLKNYEDLRPTNVFVPRILVVVLVPRVLADWIAHSEEALALRRCGYWASLRGFPPTANAESVTVRLPRKNHFTVEQLQGMIKRVGDGGLP